MLTFICIDMPLASVAPQFRNSKAKVGGRLPRAGTSALRFTFTRTQQRGWDFCAFFGSLQNSAVRVMTVTRLPLAKIKKSYLFIRVWGATRVRNWLEYGVHARSKKVYAVPEVHQKGGDGKTDIECSPSSSYSTSITSLVLNLCRPSAYWLSLLSFSYALRLEATLITCALQLNNSRRRATT